MVRSLPPGEFDCHIAVPAPPPLAQELRDAGATVHVVPMERISTSHRPAAWVGYAARWPVSVARLARLARRIDADVVHTNSLHSWYGWAASWCVRRPHVWHAREIVVQSRAALRVERLLARRFATTVIAMSAAVAAQLDPANVTVIYETADPTRFRPDLAGRFRRRVGIPDDAPLLGAASRVDTWKGLGVLLDAWERISDEHAGAHLVVAGGPVAGKEDYARRLAERAAALPRAHWLGARDDIPELLADLDVFTQPSTEPEPYGLSVVEALASGVAAIVTDAGGASEILDRSPFGTGAGARVPPGDAPALARAVASLLPDTTSVERRRQRASLQPPSEDERFAAVFREAAGVEGPLAG